MTQYLEARSGTITPEMIAVAKAEFLEPEAIH
jgi:thiamine biosynthesis protein ThiC